MKKTIIEKANEEQLKNDLFKMKTILKSNNILQENIKRVIVFYVKTEIDFVHRQQHTKLPNLGLITRGSINAANKIVKTLLKG